MANAALNKTANEALNIGVYPQKKIMLILILLIARWENKVFNQLTDAVYYFFRLMYNQFFLWIGG
ncbi:hypothetical protein TI05_01415 [Achromatium sp. WMS3]|nr:hypothetical protein TI05_01415 [Achromatium sp. WMS3]